VITRFRQFHYDGDSRVRYLVRDRDAASYEPTQSHWREYLGSSVYADLDVETDGSSAITRRYLHAADGMLVGWREGWDPGDPNDPNDDVPGEWHFVHADLVGTTRVVTDPNGVVGAALGYTAFGERLIEETPGGDPARSRYGFCGAWGYQDDGLEDALNEIGMLHVGARYYDPSLGRFLQRDRIGMTGGRNVYAYADDNPVAKVDPTGESPFLMGVVWFSYGAGFVIGFKVGHAMMTASNPWKATSLGREIAEEIAALATTTIGVYCVTRFVDRTGMLAAGVVGPMAATIGGFAFGFHQGLIEGVIAGGMP
jgi:RHS repeat-associated protein